MSDLDPAFDFVRLDPLLDGPVVANVNVPAFHGDAHWLHQWSGVMSLGDIIHDTALRTPQTLLNQRHAIRCLKAVHRASGEMVAYVRFILPDSLVGNESVWPEAVVSDVTDKADRETLQAQYHSTQDPKTGMSRGLNREMVMLLGGPPDREDGRIRKAYSDREFLELDYLAVKPGWQGKGLGRIMVREGIARAHQMGCHLIIMGYTKSGCVAYERMNELKLEGVVRMSCAQWPAGREDGCEMVIKFFVALWDDHREAIDGGTIVGS